MWQDKQAAQPLRIAIVGRPNMGKSTLINSLINEERLLTGPESLVLPETLLRCRLNGMARFIN